MIEFLGQKQAAELAERRALERELAKVSIKKEDVDLVTTFLIRIIQILL